MGSARFKNQTAPATPASGYTEAYVDSTTKELKTINDTGATKTYDALPNTTKGDITTYTTVNASLAVGTNGQTLQANSATATGLEWATQTLDDTSGTLSISKGGTGQTSQTNAFDALSPTTTKGDLIASNGSDNVRLAVGSNGTVLKANSATATGLEWAADSTEATTVSNIGVAGVGIFKQITGTDIELKKVNAGSSKITITDDTGNNEVDIDVVEANLTLTSIGGTLSIAKGGTGQTTQTAAMDALSPSTTKGDLIVHDGSDNIRVAVGTNNHVLTADSAQASGLKWAAPATNGDVVGPASSTDNEMPRFDSTTGKLIQGSKLLVDDNGAIYDKDTGRYVYIPAPYGMVWGAEMIGLSATSNIGANFANNTDDGGAVTWDHFSAADAVHENDFGRVRLFPSTTTLSTAAVYIGQQPFTFSNGSSNIKMRFEANIWLSAGWSAGNRGDLMIGFGDNATTIPQGDGAYFFFDGGAPSFWKVVTADNSTRTTTTTSTAGSTTTKTHLRVDMDESAGEVKFYINNSLVATHTTNLPGADRMFGYMSNAERQTSDGTNIWAYIFGIYGHVYLDTARFT